MNGLALMGLATLVFLIAAAAIFAATVGMLRFAGRAMNPNRTGGQRALYAALALLCFLGVFAAAAAGFAGIAALLFDVAVQDDLPSF